MNLEVTKKEFLVQESTQKSPQEVFNTNMNSKVIQNEFLVPNRLKTKSKEDSSTLGAPFQNLCPVTSHSSATALTYTNIIIMFMLELEFLRFFVCLFSQVAFFAIKLYNTNITTQSIRKLKGEKEKLDI